MKQEFRCHADVLYTPICIFISPYMSYVLLYVYIYLPRTEVDLYHLGGIQFLGVGVISTGSQ